MIRYLKVGVKHALGLHRPGRRLPVRPDDILLASYPYSGDVRLSLLIANLIYPDAAIDSSNLHRFIIDPDITAKRDIDRAPKPRVIKTHSSFDPRYRRVIYMVRDPRDVFRAQYATLRRSHTISDEITVEAFTGLFLTGELDRYIGAWGENAASWLASRSRYPGFCLLRYEDFFTETAHELMRVAKFAGWPASEASIARAIDRSSSDEKSANGQSDLPAPQVARIEHAWGDIMACLGYETVSHAQGKAGNASLIELLAGGISGSARDGLALQ